MPQRTNVDATRADPGFELSNMNWGWGEKFLHGRMSRTEFFEPKNPIKS